MARKTKKRADKRRKVTKKTVDKSDENVVEKTSEKRDYFDDGTLKYNFKYVLLTLAASVISYVSVLNPYIKFPHVWTTILILGFLVLLLKNFKRIEGIKVLVYYVTWNLFILPTVFVGITGLNKIISAQIIFIFITLMINLILFLFMIYGLMKLKKWGLYFSLVVLALFIVNTGIGLFVGSLNIFPSLSENSFIIRNIVHLVFLILGFVYLIKVRKYFY
jgi:hypothetical protein